MAPDGDTHPGSVEVDGVAAFLGLSREGLETPECSAFEVAAHVEGVRVVLDGGDDGVGAVREPPWHRYRCRFRLWRWRVSEDDLPLV